MSTWIHMNTGCQKSLFDSCPRSLRFILSNFCSQRHGHSTSSKETSCNGNMQRPISSKWSDIEWYRHTCFSAFVAHFWSFNINSYRTIGFPVTYLGINTKNSFWPTGNQFYFQSLVYNLWLLNINAWGGLHSAVIFVCIVPSHVWLQSSNHIQYCYGSWWPIIGHFSQSMTKHTKLPEHPGKTEISLPIHVDWLGSLLYTLVPSQESAQADLSSCMWICRFENHKCLKNINEFAELSSLIREKKMNKAYQVFILPVQGLPSIHSASPRFTKCSFCQSKDYQVLILQVQGLPSIHSASPRLIKYSFCQSKAYQVFTLSVQG